MAMRAAMVMRVSMATAVMVTVVMAMVVVEISDPNYQPDRQG
jgi:type IV secretory pathway VirB3-like protein